MQILSIISQIFLEGRLMFDADVVLSNNANFVFDNHKSSILSLLFSCIARKKIRLILDHGFKQLHYHRMLRVIGLCF
jgi:hypothetical protein